MLKRGDLVLFDRNNHKSLHHGALIQAGAIPIFLPTARNPFGMIGAVDWGAWDEDYLRQQIRKNPLVKDPQRYRTERPFRLACIQLCTYDGTIYNVQKVLERIGHLCDLNIPLVQALPDLVRAHSDRYKNLGLRDLANEMFSQLQESRQTRWLAEAFSTLPKPLMTPRQAYRQLVLNEVEKVALDRLADHVVATSVVPYPPGIPMLMPGESAGTPNGPYLSYLRALQSWDERFPGFGHDTHGVENLEGTYYVYCLKEAKRRTGISDDAVEMMSNDEHTPVGTR